MLALYIVTLALYLLNFTGFRLGGFVLAGGSALKDEPVDVVFGLAYLGCTVLFAVAPDIGKFAVLAFLLLVIAGQCWFTFRFWIWPNADKIRRYNAFFAGTHYILPPSGTRLVPNTYHIINFAAVLVNLIATAAFIAG